ncbi:signal transduction histidine kinase [Neisseria sp. HSC-16F19]|nr:ATP-binding protein [Neisseria sp. HSC-16F19]MCP2039527.1 signal transduction histidine kinase [Neisseria sp. HSC-16F19]
MTSMSTLRRYSAVLLTVLSMLLIAALVGYFNYKESEHINRNINHIDVAGYASDGFYKLTLHTHYLESDLNRIRSLLSDESFSRPSLHDNAVLQASLNDLKQDRADIQYYLETLRHGGMFAKSDLPSRVAPLTDPRVEPALTQVEAMWQEYDAVLQKALTANLNTAEGLSALDQLVLFTRNHQVDVYNTLDIIITELTTDNRNRTRFITRTLLYSALLLLMMLLFFVRFVISRLVYSDNVIDKAHHDLEVSFAQLSQAKTELEQSYNALDTARQATQAIMDNVSTGLGLINHELCFNPKYSRQLSFLLGTPDLAGRSLADVLSEIAEDRRPLESLGEFINQMFQPNVRERWISDLNPLRDVRVRIPDEYSGEPVSRHLDFQLKRVFRKHADGSRTIIGILTSVTDITDSVILQNKIISEKESKLLQLETLNRMTDLDPATRNAFVQNLTSHADDIQAALKQKGHSGEFLRRKLETVSRHIHAVKGDSALLDFDIFNQLCDKAEEHLSALRQKTVLVADDFAPVGEIADELSSLTRAFGNLTQVHQDEPEVIVKTTPESESNLQDVAPAMAPEHDPNDASHWERTILDDEFAALIQGADCDECADHHDDCAQIIQSTEDEDVVYSSDNVAADGEETLLQLFAQQLDGFAEEIAHSKGKEVKLYKHGLGSVRLSDEETNIVQDIIIQCLRNSIVHGIETPEERLEQQKEAAGKVHVHLTAEEKQLVLEFADDGYGLDSEAIKEKAVSQGWLTEEQAENISESDMIRLIFSNGFSTAKQPDIHAGQGVGLDIVRNHICSTDPPGKLSVYNCQGKGVKFSITLPRR